MPSETNAIQDIRQYPGTVTATFSDAVIASTDSAPERDVYREFLSRSSTRPPSSDDTRDWWDVSAVGEGHGFAAWTVNETAESFGRLRGYFCFDPVAIGIEANPEQHGEDSTELP
jgi:uncharacterized protein (DUF427 family)